MMFTYLVQQDKFFLLRWADYLPPMPCYNHCWLVQIFEGPQPQGQKLRGLIFKAKSVSAFLKRLYKSVWR